MKTSRKTRIRKRDGSIEDFDVAKLAGTLRRAIERLENVSANAEELAQGIYIYLRRSRRVVVSSSALFGMVVKVLRRVRLGDAAELLEMHRTLRMVRRRLLRVRHDDGYTTQWDKSWLAALTQRMWHVSSTTARILAGQIEMHLLPQEESEISRRDVLDLLNRHVAQWGLAEAVPVTGASER